jgi:hypothetical protein
MSKRVKVWHLLVGVALTAACETSPVATAPESFESVAASRGVPTTGRDPQTRPDADRRRTRDQNRLAAAARAAIDDAKDMWARAAELADRDDRPAIHEALGEARQLIEQAIGAYENADYGRALVKARNAIDLLSQVLRALT